MMFFNILAAFSYFTNPYHNLPSLLRLFIVALQAAIASSQIWIHLMTNWAPTLIAEPTTLKIHMVAIVVINIMVVSFAIALIVLILSSLNAPQTPFISAKCAIAEVSQPFLSWSNALLWDSIIPSKRLNCKSEPIIWLPNACTRASFLSPALTPRLLKLSVKEGSKVGNGHQS